ncbi:hypothetical protein L1987_29436 [Smallanthus sonchifolius]|uniref:Uncharacterized protein n=1 Tax=Smallanthus sonchifolius TaxID=185202 RepID=A0ACB9I0L0_9ASTR|nr:hypothetical protein L1987_29436 [Smallanthus sonchifolius]
MTSPDHCGSTTQPPGPHSRFHSFPFLIVRLKAKQIPPSPIFITHTHTLTVCLKWSRFRRVFLRLFRHYLLDFFIFLHCPQTSIGLLLKPLISTKD